MIPREKLYIHLPFLDLIENLESFPQLGVNCEIYMSAENLDSISRAQKERINAVFEKHNLNKSLHAPFSDLNPGSIDKTIRAASLDRFKQSLEVCANLKADRMVMHTHFDPIFYKNHKELWLDNSIQSLAALSKYARQKNITILIENSIDQSPWAVLELIKRTDNLKACFDIAHYNVFSPLGWEKEFAEYPPELITEVHLSDNRGSEDEHLPLGEGSIDFKKFFKMMNDRKLKPYIVLEPHDKEGLFKNLEYIRTLNIYR